MQEIAGWLDKLGMSEYAQRFAENRIDFSVLSDLSDQDLQKMGVVLGDRRKILRAIAAISDSGKAAHKTALRQKQRQPWNRGMPPSAARSRWHCNVGGGYSDAGLSDQALVWMIARLQALTGLEFDIDAVKAGTRPNISGATVDSTKGWPIDHTFPH